VGQYDATDFSMLNRQFHELVAWGRPRLRSTKQKRIGKEPLGDCAGGTCVGGA